MTDHSDDEPTLFDITPKPAKFDYFYTGENWPPEIDCPKHLPRTAIHIGTVEWSWSPANSRIDSYHLSSNRSHTHWILWVGNFDDNETFKWIHTPYAYGLKKGVSAKTAAADLILAAWQGEITCYGPDSIEPFHMVTAEGLLSKDELYALTKQVWTETGQTWLEGMPSLDQFSNPVLLECLKIYAGIKNEMRIIDRAK